MRFEELGFFPPQAAAPHCPAFHFESSEVITVSQDRVLGMWEGYELGIFILLYIPGQETKMKNKCARDSWKKKRRVMSTSQARHFGVLSSSEFGCDNHPHSSSSGPTQSHSQGNTSKRHGGLLGELLVLITHISFPAARECSQHHPRLDE